MKRVNIIYTVLVIILVIAALLGVCVGSTYISIKSIVNSLLSVLNNNQANVNDTIILTLRIPRTIISISVGGSLALAGVLSQSVFKNPMAEPYIIGVSSGASLGAVISTVFVLSSKFILATPLLSFSFAILTTFIVYMLSRKNGYSNTTTLLLSGIAITSLIGALINLILYSLMEEWLAVREVMFWMMGSFEGKTMIHALIVMPATIILFFITIRLSNSLDIIALGDNHAITLGIDIEKMKRIIIIIIAILTATSVSVSGMIGFVGLVIPHIGRLLVGTVHKYLIPVSILLGSVFLTLVDILIRVASPYINLKLGVVTALIGSPFFLYLLMKKRKSTYISEY